MDKDTRLGILASAILDGTPIDWPAAVSTGDAADQEVVRQMQIVAEIAALHRNLDPTRSSAPTSLPHLDETRPAIAWGHLQLLEPVGRGTFGEVYRAWDTNLDREVALKLLRTAPATGDPSASLSDPARVVNEGRLLARVRHPNVITVYGAEPRDGRVGIWMEFIRGRTLHEIVEQQGAFGAREAASIGIDLCHALAAVHRAGLLHRDLTARNAMREEGGRVVLMDFGAGHESHGSSARSSSSVMGTPLYMAPELFAGVAADQRTDIYALGTLLYYLVTRDFPVTGRSLIDIRAAHAQGARARLRDVRPDLPAAFVRAIEQATAADPAQRFLTAGDLETALDAAMRATPAIADAAPSTGRWRLAAVLAAAVAATAVTATLTKRADLLGGGPPATAQGSAAALVVTERKRPTPAGLSMISNPSDDGRFVAAMVNDTGDAAIVDLVSGTYRPLGISNTDANGYASFTALSPDGSAVAVNWHQGDKDSLHVIQSDGSGHRVLIDTAADVWVYQWSRDASLILTVITAADGTNTIALVAAADGAVRPIYQLGAETTPELMTLSPDGRFVAYDYPQAAAGSDRDVFILDTHTGAQWPLAPSPDHDTAPLWSPDGKAIVFFSDRSRTLSAWMVPMDQGRAQSEPRLVKDDVGRVWPLGFTRDGALHYNLWTGFAEVYVAAIDGTASAPEPLSPRQALSNFNPVWSTDGRFIAYSSERRAKAPRELWVYDTTTRREERVPVEHQFERPTAWSPDSRHILVAKGTNGPLFTVDRATGDTKLVSKTAQQARWLPEGIVFVSQKSVVLQSAVTGRRIRSLDFSDAGIVGFAVALDGRAVLALWKNGRMTLTDVLTGTTREWAESGLAGVGRLATAPRSSAVAYAAFGKDSAGEWMALKVAAGAGEPRELLRARGERLALQGWTPDGLNVLVARWTPAPPHTPDPIRMTTLWRVPIDGSAPVSTGLTMDALRDVSLHPDGRRIAFNAGFKDVENHVLENLLAQ